MFFDRPVCLKSPKEALWNDEAKKRGANFIVTIIDNFFFDRETVPHHAKNIGEVMDIIARTEDDQYAYVGEVLMVV